MLLLILINIKFAKVLRLRALLMSVHYTVIIDMYVTIIITSCVPFTPHLMDNVLSPTVFEGSTSGQGKSGATSPAKRAAATDSGGILVSALRQEPKTAI